MHMSKCVHRHAAPASLAGRTKTPTPTEQHTAGGSGHREQPSAPQERGLLTGGGLPAPGRGRKKLTLEHPAMPKYKEVLTNGRTPHKDTGARMERPPNAKWSNLSTKLIRYSSKLLTVTRIHGSVVTTCKEF